MSLIQEALKRKDEDDGRVPSDASQVISGPPPREPLVKKESPSGWGAMLGLLILIVLLLGAALAVLFYLARKDSSASVDPHPQPGPPEEVTTQSSSHAPLTPAEPEAAGLPVSSATAPTQTVVIAPTGLMAAPPTPFELDDDEELLIEQQLDRWPRLTLGGVVSRGDPNTSAAVLDGDVIGVGEEARGVMVIEVESSGVWLEWRGERRFLRVGRTIK